MQDMILQRTPGISTGDQVDPAVPLQQKLLVLLEEPSGSLIQQEAIAG